MSNGFGILPYRLGVEDGFDVKNIYNLGTVHGLIDLSRTCNSNGTY